MLPTMSLASCQVNLPACMLLHAAAKEDTANISLFADHMQAERWGADLLTEDVEHVDLSKRPFTVRTSDTEVLSQLRPAYLHCIPTFANSITNFAVVSVR